MKHLITIFASLLMVLSFTACSSDDDENNTEAMAAYVGTWVCSSPATYYSSTTVTVGTTLQIASSGAMTWTTSSGKTYSATMKALGDDWANITYNGKTYKQAEVYVSNNTLHINVNGAEDLTVKDFPFDGAYRKSN